MGYKNIDSQMMDSPTQVKELGRNGCCDMWHQFLLPVPSMQTCYNTALEYSKIL
jgi:hypothetical protein